MTKKINALDEYNNRTLHDYILPSGMIDHYAACRFRKEVWDYISSKVSPEILDKLKENADKLHSCFCHVNHTDGCGYYYCTSDTCWVNEFSHSEYLIKAYNLHLMGVDDVNWLLKVVSICNGDTF